MKFSPIKNPLKPYLLSLMISSLLKIPLSEILQKSFGIKDDNFIELLMSVVKLFKFLLFFFDHIYFQEL